VTIEVALGLIPQRHRLYYWLYLRVPHMATRYQNRAIKNYRSRLAARGLTRFEVLGRAGDRELVRSVARCLADGGAGADRLRGAVKQVFSGEPPRKGGILKALLASPLIGSDLELTRPRERGRKVDI
jgi:hypothetical protein